MRQLFPIKRKGHGVHAVLLFLVAVYISSNLLIHSRMVTEGTAHYVSSLIQKNLSQNVTFSDVQLIRPCGVEIHGMTVFTPEGDTLANIGAVTVRMKLLPLMLRRRIELSGIRLLNPDIRLTAESKDGRRNYQFILDLLSNPDKKRKGFPAIQANSVLVKNGRVTFDILDQPQTEGTFNKSHIGLYGINANIALKEFSTDSANISIRGISFSERSGLRLDNLKGRIGVGKHLATIEDFLLEMPGTRLRAPLLSAGVGMTGRDSIPSINVLISGSYLNPSDLKAVIPALSTFDDRMTLDVTAGGTTERLTLGRLNLASAGREFSINISGIAGALETNPRAESLNVRLNGSDALCDWLNRVLEGTGVKVPAIAGNLGSTEITLTGRGDIKDNTIIGNVGMKNVGGLSLNFSKKRGVGNITVITSAGGLNLARLTGNHSLDKVMMKASVSDERFDSARYFRMVNVDISELGFKGYTYRNISFTGEFNPDTYNLNAVVADANAQLDGTFRYRPLTKGLTAEVTLPALDLAALKLTDKDSVMVVSGKMTADLRGTGIDDLRGRLTIDDISYRNSSEENLLHSIELMSREVFDGKLLTSLSSEFGNVTIIGTYSLGTIAQSITGLLRRSLPSVFRKIDNGGKLFKPSSNNFNIYATLLGNGKLEQALDLPVSINGLSVLTASFNDRSESVEMAVTAPSVTVKGKLLTDLSFVLSNRTDSIYANLAGVLDNDGMTYGISTSIQGRNDSLTALAKWEGSQEGRFEGELSASALFGPYDGRTGILRSRLGIDDTWLVVNGVDWHLDQTAIVSDSGRMDVEGFHLWHGDQFITASGSISSDTTRTLGLELKSVDIGSLLYMAGNSSLDLSGTVSGEVFGRSISDKPIVYGNIEADNLSFMGTRFGTVRADGNWDSQQQLVRVAADIDDRQGALSTATGYFAPKTSELDISIKSTGLDLHFLGAFIPSKVLTIEQARTTADLRLFGTTKNLDISGTAYLDDAKLHVKPNNSTYFIPRDTLVFNPGEMLFNNIRVFDDSGNQGMMDLQIRHDHFKDIRLNLALNSQGIQVFYIPYSESSSVYGKFFVGGSPRLYTGPDITYIYGSCRTTRGTYINLNAGVNNADTYEFLTIRDASKTGEQSDVTETEKNPAKGKDKNNNGKSAPISANVNAEITEEAIINADMNSLKGSISGNGDIAVKYDQKNGITANGIFNVSHGNCNLSLQNLLNREFEIRNDSRVVFNGMLPNSTLDIHAYHEVNSVSMQDLDPSTKSTSNVRAQCLMDVGGTISRPQLSFNVDIPQASADERDLLASVTNTEEQRNMQFMYLLAIHRFYTYDYSAGGNAAAVTPTAMESLLTSTISGQINNLLSQVINSNYLSLSSNVSTGYLVNDPTAYVNNTFEGILQARLLNNRLLFNGSFGYMEDNLNNRSGIIGDFELKWLLLPKIGISLLGYSRNNQRYFTKTTLNTQGVGVAYEKDFDRFIRRKEEDGQ